MSTLVSPCRDSTVCKASFDEWGVASKGKIVARRKSDEAELGTIAPDDTSPRSPVSKNKAIPGCGTKAAHQTYMYMGEECVSLCYLISSHSHNDGLEITSSMPRGYL